MSQPTDETPALTRRDFLRGGAAAGAPVQPPVQPPAQPSPKRLQPRRLARRIAGVNDAAQPTWLLDPTDEWENWSLRLARRVTLGLTPEEAQRARTLGYARYLEYQLDYTSIDDAAVDAFVATKWPALAQTGAALSTQATGTLQTQLQESTVYRAAFSKRQLYQRMVEFWSDHFNISFSKVGYLKILDDREVIRKHALGTFPDLLKASAHSAAMLVYLDQQVSRRQAPNQNYARELMELHTLGVDGGYTQQDVAELSRILTGWTVAGRGDFAFAPSQHDFGAKTLLGTAFPAVNAMNQTNPQGVQEGEAALDLLVNHPSTAKFIARKMLRWLLWYDPSPEMIDAVAAEYTRTKGDIKAMVRTSLGFQFLQQAPAKFKRPFHWLVSAIRASGAVLNAAGGANRLLSSLGHAQFVWDTPDGYPDVMEYWAGNLLPRWNAATTIANSNNAAEMQVDVTALQQLGTADAVAAALGKRVFGGEMGDRTRAELVAYLKPTPTNAVRIREALALALASSSFQWY
ncbi:protein of unknown function DUF1800 [Gemmatirosa kalamazoonensis]|uniref:DUF1800 domain-containing protein n=1 Tax=Gemmatirosa kalamazoonensis TaxID=861299 RepID=W0RQU4_9BACT|nr:DUF1800 domain-containing protein [Gemmatirosa kalamazoonensis]AHG91938.1 protein of unknown function DUF1800 [Gemmatirosa kalamazoonensis]